MDPTTQQDQAEFKEQLRTNQLQQLFNYLPGIYFVAKSRDGRTMMANELAALETPREVQIFLNEEIRKTLTQLSDEG